MSNFEKDEFEVFQHLNKVNLAQAYSNVKFCSDKDKDKNNDDMKFEIDVSRDGSDKTDDEEFKREDQFKLFKSSNLTKKYESILKHAYYFLAYCCLQENRYDEAIRYSNILRRDFELPPLVRFNVALYLTEAHISKGNHSEAFNVLRAENTESKLTPASTYENILTGLPEDTPLTCSAIVFLNMATLNFLTDNLEEAQSSIEQVIQANKLNGDVNALAYALIYMNLRKGDTESALKIIKKRQISLDFSEPNSEIDLQICY